MRETKGEAVSATEMFNRVFTGAAERQAAESCGGKPVSWVVSCKDHDFNQRSGQREQQFLAGTRSDVSDCIHRTSMALLASVCLSAAGPLQNENLSTLLEAEGDTHTHTHKRKRLGL